MRLDDCGACLAIGSGEDGADGDGGRVDVVVGRLADTAVPFVATDVVPISVG